VKSHLANVSLVVSVAIMILLVAAAATTTAAYSTTTTTTAPLSAGGGEQEAVSSTTTTNNVSNALLGSLFLVVEFERTSVNPVNETYIETTGVSNLTIIPPNATTTTTTINATLTSNATVNILTNGLVLYRGQSLIMTEGDDDGGTAEQENATTAFVDISRTNPDGTVVGTGVVFFSTNSTGQLAFLDNMVGISQTEFSPEGGTIRMWEWKGGGTLPFESGTPAPPPYNRIL
jgi:hypothetical protein